VANPEERLEELLEQRRPLYAHADLHVFQGGGSPQEVAQQVLAALPGVLKERPRPPDPDGPTPSPEL
jgi:shikimate kinase